MKPDRSLAVQVAAAVGAMLVGRDSITLGEVEQALPSALRAGKPSHKSITKAIVAAGWIATRQPGGAIVYRPPDAVDDPAAGIGHNSAIDQLLTYFERIERLVEERKVITATIVDVMTEAKNEGYDPAAMRVILRERAMDPEKRMSQLALVDLYASVTDRKATDEA